MHITANFHKDFTNIIVERVKSLIISGFKFPSYKKWKKRKIQLSGKIIEGSIEDEKLVNEENLFKEYNNELVHLYFNLLHKIPSQVPRTIFFCKGFECPVNLKKGLDYVINKIEKGEDLFPNLSRQIMDPKFYDTMLYDFGIYHFHLGVEPLKIYPSLNKGTNEIIYCMMDNENCYLIEINTHGNWNETRLLEKVKRDFPEIINRWRIEGEPTIKITSKERNTLLKNGINTFVEIDGEYYVSPGWGVNTAGTSSLAVLKMNNEFRKIVVLEKNITTMLLKSSEQIEKDLGINEMHLIVQEINPLVIYDKINRIKINVIQESEGMTLEFY
jgi:hypothetical protein